MAVSNPVHEDESLLLEPAINLTSFGEFLVWTAEGAELLRRKHRIIGRASMSAEPSKKVRGAQGRADSLPIRLSFEEVNLCLYSGFVTGFYHTSPVSQSSKPSQEQLDKYEEALRQNVIESTQLHQAQKRLRLVGHYSQLLSGRKIHMKRALNKQSDVVNGDQMLNQVGKSALSIRAERRLRRSQVKRRREISINDTENNLTTNDTSESDDQSIADLNSNRLPTLDELIDQYDSDLLSKSNKSPERFFPQTAQHLPRPTPRTWRRNGEREWIGLDEEIRSRGFYAVALWLFDQIQLLVPRQNMIDSGTLSQTKEIQLRQLLSRCRIYADLWAKDLFITTATVKMGGDFLIYRGDPLLHHGCYIISISLPEEIIESRSLSAKLRIANSLRKILVLANVPQLSKSVDLSSLRSGTVPVSSPNSDSISYVTLQFVSARSYHQPR